MSLISYWTSNNPFVFMERIQFLQKLIDFLSLVKTLGMIWKTMCCLGHTKIINISVPKGALQEQNQRFFFIKKNPKKYKISYWTSYAPFVKINRNTVSRKITWFPVFGYNPVNDPKTFCNAWLEQKIVNISVSI